MPWTKLHTLPRSHQTANEAKRMTKQPNPMTGLSKLTAKRFCELCNDAYTSWITRRSLFDDNPNIGNPLPGTEAAHGFARLSEITMEHSLLQVGKLHDKAVIAGKITLSIDYVLTYGGWNDSASQRLDDLAKKLNEFANSKSMRDARNKTLAHNDLAAVLPNTPLGGFEEDLDIDYFQTLEQFASEVWQAVTGETWSFPKQAEAFAKALADGISLD